MTFFSLIALALGMIAAADAAAPRPSFAAIAIQRGSRASRRAVRAAIADRAERGHGARAVRLGATAVRRFLAPLTGAVAPRAPASIR
jgi:hypothetical protein